MGEDVSEHHYPSERWAWRGWDRRSQQGRWKVKATFLAVCGGRWDHERVRHSASGAILPNPKPTLAIIS